MGIWVVSNFSQNFWRHNSIFLWTSLRWVSLDSVYTMLLIHHYLFSCGDLNFFSEYLLFWFFFFFLPWFVLVWIHLCLAYSLLHCSDFSKITMNFTDIIYPSLQVDTFHNYLIYFSWHSCKKRSYYTICRWANSGSKYENISAQFRKNSDSHNYHTLHSYGISGC